MKVLSLFSGVGGFDLGLERAGMETVFQCEFDKHCNTILAEHWPTVPKWGDISTLTGDHILSVAPVIDVVAWGSPCQDLSVAGKRAGLEGEKSNLFHQGIRIIKELREASNGRYPRISIWENVVGALNSNSGADFGIILDQMAEAGALVIEWAVLDAQHFGVPQRRRRVFVVAIFDPATAGNCPNPLLPVRESVPRNLAKGKQKGQTVTTETTGSFGNSGFNRWTETDQAITLSARDHKSSNTLMIEPGAEWWDGQPTAATLTATSDDQRMPDKGRLQVVIEPFTPSSHAGYSKGVGTLRAYGGDLGGGSETLLCQQMRVRRLTPQECELLMSWPPTVLSVRILVCSDQPSNGVDAEKSSPRSQNVAGLADQSQSQNTASSVAICSPASQAKILKPVVVTAKINLEAGRIELVREQNGPQWSVSIAEKSSKSEYVIVNRPHVARLCALLHIALANYRQDGKVVSQPKKTSSVRVESGVPLLTLYGSEITPLANIVQSNIEKTPADFMSIMSLHTLNTQQNDWILKTLCCYALSVITGYIPNGIDTKSSLLIELQISCGHTQLTADGTEQADGHRYRQCGNGVASNVAEWIGKHLMKLNGGML